MKKSAMSLPLQVLRVAGPLVVLVGLLYLGSFIFVSISEYDSEVYALRDSLPGCDDKGISKQIKYKSLKPVGTPEQESPSLWHENYDLLELYTNEPTPGNVDNAIIFVHGHEGSFRQARWMAGALKSLTDANKELEKVRIYTVDFQYEPSALSGLLMQRQIDTLKSMLQYFEPSVKDQIILVGHSMGGVVVRAAIAELMASSSPPIVSSKIRLVVTLASPLVPLHLSDSQFLSIYRNINSLKHYQDLQLINYSGGLADHDVMPASQVPLMAAGVETNERFATTSRVHGLLRDLDHNELTTCYLFLQLLLKEVIVPQLFSSFRDGILEPSEDDEIGQIQLTHYDSTSARKHEDVSSITHKFSETLGPDHTGLTTSYMMQVNTANVTEVIICGGNLTLSIPNGQDRLAYDYSHDSFLVKTHELHSRRRESITTMCTSAILVSGPEKAPESQPVFVDVTAGSEVSTYLHVCQRDTIGPTQMISPFASFHIEISEDNGDEYHCKNDMSFSVNEQSFRERLTLGSEVTYMATLNGACNDGPQPSLFNCEALDITTCVFHLTPDVNGTHTVDFSVFTQSDCEASVMVRPSYSLTLVSSLDAHALDMLFLAWCSVWMLIPTRFVVHRGFGVKVSLLVALHLAFISEFGAWLPSILRMGMGWDVYPMPASAFGLLPWLMFSVLVIVTSILDAIVIRIFSGLAESTVSRNVKPHKAHIPLTGLKLIAVNVILSLALGFTVGMSAVLTYNLLVASIATAVYSPELSGFYVLLALLSLATTLPADIANDASIVWAPVDLRRCEEAIGQLGLLSATLVPWLMHTFVENPLAILTLEGTRWTYTCTGICIILCCFIRVPFRLLNLSGLIAPWIAAVMTQRVSPVMVPSDQAQYIPLTEVSDD